MKIRDGQEHAQELIQADVLTFSFDIMVNDPNFAKYKTWKLNKNESIIEKPTLGHWRQAKQLRQDSLDLVYGLGALFELCRYPSGCVALAKFQEGEGLRCIQLLPTEKMFLIGLHLCLKPWFEDKGIVDVDWGSAFAFELGMIQQGFIDLVGRVLVGLKQHPSLLAKSAELIYRGLMGPFKDEIEAIQNTMEVSCIPNIQHCISPMKSFASVLSMVVKVLQGKNADYHPGTVKPVFKVERRRLNSAGESLHAGQQCHGCGKGLEGKLLACSKW